MSATRKPLPPNPGPLIARLYAQKGLTYRQIVDRYRVSHRTIHRLLREQGVTSRANYPTPREQAGDAASEQTGAASSREEVVR
ncbi:helix-turn-helix domain-containing protein [Amycolatopsis kentuckyensis]|uniref:helix-turn-helix domain-containing protein n=1 Tax=Amycolatopsis kentuckyensis TaxID=218823 RepID=UPI003565CF2E